MKSAVAIGDGPLVPGPAVRREYLKLSRDLALLTGSFGIAVPPQLQRDAAVLTLSIECADRLLDAIPRAEERARFSAAVVSYLGEESLSEENLGPELAGWLAQLKEVAGRHGVSDRFREIVRELLSNSEHMRRTESHGRFVECAVREGRLMVELLLMILAGISTPRFDSFMRELSGPANLSDKLRDAQRDYQRGEIAIRPTTTYRARLVCELLRRTLRLTRFCAGNLRLATWGIGSIFTELIWFRFSKSDSH